MHIFFQLGGRFFFRHGFFTLFDKSRFVFFIEFADFFDNVSVAAIDQLVIIESLESLDEEGCLLYVSLGGICFGKCFVALGANGNQFIEMSHIFFWTAGLVSSLCVWLASGVTKKNRRETLHLVFLLKSFVLLFELGIQFFLLWEV